MNAVVARVVFSQKYAIYAIVHVVIYAIVHVIIYAIVHVVIYAIVHVVMLSKKHQESSTVQEEGQTNEGRNNLTLNNVHCLE